MKVSIQYSAHSSQRAKSSCILHLASCLLPLVSCLLFLTSCAPSTSVRKKEAITIEKPKDEFIPPKKKISVVEFENKTAYGQRRLGTAASDVLLTELGKSKKFILIERSKLDKVMEEQKLQTTGMTDANTAVQMGKILGLDAIVVGSISQFGVKTGGSDYLITQSKQQVAECTVDIRVIEVETGRIIYIDSGKGVAKSSKGSFLGMGTKGGYDETLEGEALRAAIAKFVDNIVFQVNARPWSCRVAEVDENNIYLDAGQESNLKIGTKLVVYHQGKEIRSPDTGMVIGKTEEKVGEVAVADYFGDNGSTAKVLSGSKPSRGDLCRLIR
ncbi:MAG: CsgG/HfaB family protein [Elusimicrobia bacterium]|nr:CsgG/HfaB family protein [Elusimicrobiota bacterium]